MQDLAMVRSLAPMVAAALLLCACETATLAPAPRTSPAPAARETAQGTSLAEYDALLQAMHPGQPVDPRRRETVRALAETLGRMAADAEAGTGAAALSPSAERALREFAASPRGMEMQEVLERMIAGRAVPDGRP